jgi:hypothetical protein
MSAVIVQGKIVRGSRDVTSLGMISTIDAQCDQWDSQY